MNGLVRACGKDSFAAVCKASLSSDPSAPLAAYRFARFAMDEHRARSCAGCKRAASCSSAYDLRRYCPRLKGHALSNIAHPDVAGLFAVTRSVDNECEHVRQFARFEHVAAQGKRLWLARCAPRDAVTPLVMGHFARRFGSEPLRPARRNPRRDRESGTVAPGSSSKQAERRSTTPCKIATAMSSLCNAPGETSIEAPPTTRVTTRAARQVHAEALLGSLDGARRRDRRRQAGKPAPEPAA